MIQGNVRRFYPDLATRYVQKYVYTHWVVFYGSNASIKL